MFAKILIPVELSDHPHQAVEMAMTLGCPGATEVMLLYVVEPRPSLALEDEEDLRRDFLDHYGALVHHAHVRLGQLLSTLAAHGIPGRGAVAYGRRGEIILRIAQETGADLIILPAMAVGAQHNGAGAVPVRAEVAACARVPVLLLTA